MTLFESLCRAALVLLSGLVLCGCTPNGQSQIDEQKEPHFLAGKNRLNTMDFSGALESFEKALQVNPRSASAHFEAGLLYEKNKQDYAAAIYHFERFLELRPKSDYAEIVNQRILACKQELAKTVSLGPVSQGLQHEFEQLREENRRLHDELEQWKALAARLQNQTTPPTLVETRSAATSDATSLAGAAATASNAAGPVRLASASALSAGASRTHTVKPGDTPTGIARKYGVKVDALMAANPRLDARRLQIGQTLIVPSP
jgi:LysM repeat protein